MWLTAAICTWNRSALLRRALERFTQLRVDDDLQWELIVVNNNCTDDTDEVIESFADALPLRPLFEPTQGVSLARNLAVEHARGEYIVWTDDDVLVDPGWLLAYRDAIRERPEAVFGGPILPCFEGEPPQWLADHWRAVSGTFSVRDFGDAPFQFSDRRVPYGANYCVRMIEQRKHSYDPNLGLKGSSRILGEETTLVRKILAEGGTGRWVPRARVQHYIPRSRQTLSHLREKYHGQGRYHTRKALAAGRDMERYRAKVSRRLRKARLRSAFTRRFCGPGRWLRDLRKLWVCEGRLAELDG